MTRQSIQGIGYCARLTVAGDWAFAFALSLARSHGVRLNIFFFPTPPCQPHAPRGRRGEKAQLSPEKMIALERDIRLYYDQLLGDFVHVGFRLCEGDEELELRRCLSLKRDYDILVLPYDGYRCRFGGKTIERFAESMPCPTALVGPEGPEQVFVNTASKQWIEELGLSDRPWHHLDQVTGMPPAPA